MSDAPLSPTDSPPESKPLPNWLPWLQAGVVVLLLVAWLLNTPPGILGKADAVGYAVCHRIVERSFQIGGRPVSLCARCTGMYAGAMVGMIFQLFLGKRRTEFPDNYKLAVLGVFFAAFALDGTNSAAQLYLGHDFLYTPSNTLRLITGTGMGLVLAVVLLPTFNQTVWKLYSPRPYLETWKQFLGMTAFAALSVLLILSGQPAFLLPLTLLGVLGILVLLTLLYAMILMILFKRENSIEAPRQLLPWLLGGFTIGMLQIAAIDLVRFAFTGTWEGFHLVF